MNRRTFLKSCAVAGVAAASPIALFPAAKPFLNPPGELGTMNGVTWRRWDYLVDEAQRTYSVKDRQSHRYPVNKETYIKLMNGSIICITGDKKELK